MKMTEDCPGCSPLCIICIKPFHKGRCGFSIHADLQRMSELLVASPAENVANFHILDKMNFYTGEIDDSRYCLFA